MSILAAVYEYTTSRCPGNDELGEYMLAALQQLTKEQQDTFIAESDIIDDYIEQTGSYDFKYSDFEPVFIERGLEPQEIPVLK